jgi:hypothetical protein
MAWIQDGPRLIVVAVCASCGQEFMALGAAFEQVVELLTKKSIVPGVAYARRLIAEL